MNWTGNGWTFRNVRTGTYLAINGSAADGTALVANNTAAEWHIWRDDANQNTFRYYSIATPTMYASLILVIPSGCLCPTQRRTSISNYGDPTIGTPITLWTTWAGLHQTWKFTQGMALTDCILLPRTNEFFHYSLICTLLPS